MSKKIKVAAFVVLILGVVMLAAALLSHSNIAVLNPKGLIAGKERDLLLLSTFLMLLVVIPVFVLTFVISWRYRATNTKAKYMPDWDHNHLAEFVWWALPSAIILGLAVITWTSSHDLDPYKPLEASTKPITIQVVALDWKWLFIYPEQNIATVNFFEIPKDTPINFQITSDAPMNSFWIPQLGGQVYAMSGMTTQLHLMADTAVRYDGSSANISGKGFAGMRFVAQAATQADFDDWVNHVKRQPARLTSATYDQLAKPSENNPPAYYAAADGGLYDKIVMKYMMPMPETIP